MHQFDVHNTQYELCHVAWDWLYVFLLSGREFQEITLLPLGDYSADGNETPASYNEGIIPKQSPNNLRLDEETAEYEGEYMHVNALEIKEKRASPLTIEISLSQSGGHEGRGKRAA
ncbi:uncharacterized protein KY384_006220 [Bacidia gigantensis]|uniref:uncharacterized protein n=1 Tax=Bacidia gigantensis TaxID=2732470 RepID=UPI001D054D04|nr:uncharacterized protein KY384_006220 [Bacidia gigantensis]KAG8529583.1 hypothetical protein KY384_006220 [Bacidia gigantensis]